MNDYFQIELAKLRTRIIKMMKLVDGQLDKSFASLVNKDTETLEAIKQDENKLDKLDVKIDKLCQRIFALSQPVATDLRFIMASLKIGTELERMGDLAYDISKRSENLNQYPDIIKRFDIQKLTKNIEKLFKQLIESYQNGNTELASEILAECRKTNHAYKKVFNEIVGAMTKKSEVIVVATDLILVMRNIERVSGHIQNIAEIIIFIVEARIVKHSGKKQIKPAQGNGK
jgi:phosphate transport system protein